MSPFVCLCLKGLGVESGLNPHSEYKSTIQSPQCAEFTALAVLTTYDCRASAIKIHKNKQDNTSVYTSIFMCFLYLTAWSTKFNNPFSDQSLLLYQLWRFTNLTSIFLRSLLIIIVVTHIDGCNSLLWFLEETFEAILGAVQTIQAAKGPWEKNGLEDQDREISKVKMTGKIN